MAKWERLKLLLFPPKCVLCGRLLGKEETDLCHTCRVEAPEFPRAKISFSFLMGMYAPVFCGTSFAMSAAMPSAMEGSWP